jgi:hypothetical protein
LPRCAGGVPASPCALEISASVAVDFQADGHFDDLRPFPRLVHLCSSLRLNNRIVAQEKAHINCGTDKISVLLPLTPALKV